VAVAVDRRVGPDLHHGAVGPDAGERQGRRDVDVGGEPGSAVAGGPF
jgi:hypothetical protein